MLKFDARGEFQATYIVYGRCRYGTIMNILLDYEYIIYDVYCDIHLHMGPNVVLDTFWLWNSTQKTITSYT